MNIPAPGARIIVRNTRWKVTKTEPTKGGNHVIHCVGLSELVRDREARFLTSIDKDIEILEPEGTMLTQDITNGFQDSKLYIESMLRQTIPTGKDIYCGNKAAMDLLPYQLTPAKKALAEPRQRILIADAVGLGKTMECGILLSELIRRGRGRRILVVTVKSMMVQFQKEMWSRFTIPLISLDSQTLQRIQKEMPGTYNPFHFYDKSIISIDSIKKDGKYTTYIENAWWDIIVIDEAHNVAERGNKRSERATLAEILSRQSDTLILLSATPHDGNPRSFASLINMLDRTAIADPDKYTKDDIRPGIFIRRFKKDVINQCEGEFRERSISEYFAQPNYDEKYILESIHNADFKYIGRKNGSGILFKTLLLKSWLSSPDACLETVNNTLEKIKKRRKQTSLSEEETKRFITIERRNELIDADCSILEKLQKQLITLPIAETSKFNKLISVLQDKTSPLAFSGKAADDRLIVFTERIATLNALSEILPKKLGLHDDQVMVMKGTDTDEQQQKVVEEFGKELSNVRLLIATDVASEGINLHYFCNKLIHYDIPWSLMLFQQRNGRIDRYGQERTPYIGYFMTGDSNERKKVSVDSYKESTELPNNYCSKKMIDDNRILQILIKKDDFVNQNIGDPGAFFGVYSIEKEEEITGKAMENGSPENFEKQIDKNISSNDKEGDDWVLKIISSFKDENDSDVSDVKVLPTLYESEFAFIVDAIQKLKYKGISCDESEKIIKLDWKKSYQWCYDLQNNMRHLPKEIKKNDVLNLSAKKEVVINEIKRCRYEEIAWPTVQYLWELHPVVQWIQGKVSAAWVHNTAPVLFLPDIEADESLFLFFGSVPNRKGWPLLVEWFACRVEACAFQEILSLEETFERAKILKPNGFVNTALKADIDALQQILPSIVQKARIYMGQKRDAEVERLSPDLQKHCKKLETMLQKQLNVNWSKTRSDAVHGKRRLETLNRLTHEAYTADKEWMEDILCVDENPFIQLVAVFTSRRALHE